jgi:hypothetical protein
MICQQLDHQYQVRLSTYASHKQAYLARPRCDPGQFIQDDCEIQFLRATTCTQTVTIQEIWRLAVGNLYHKDGEIKTVLDCCELKTTTRPTETVWSQDVLSCWTYDHRMPYWCLKSSRGLSIFRGLRRSSLIISSNKMDRPVLSKYEGHLLSRPGCSKFAMWFQTPPGTTTGRDSR